MAVVPVSCTRLIFCPVLILGADSNFLNEFSEINVMSDPESITMSMGFRFSCTRLTLVVMALAPKKVQPGGLAWRLFNEIELPNEIGQHLFLVELRISFANFLREI